MNTDLIERRVERITDRIDALYMARKIDGVEYRRRMDDLSAWATGQYSWAESEQRARCKLGSDDFEV